MIYFSHSAKDYKSDVAIPKRLKNEIFGPKTTKKYILSTKIEKILLKKLILPIIIYTFVREMWCCDNN